MRRIILKFGMLLNILLSSLSVSAYDFKVDNICYNIISTSELTCSVNSLYQAQEVVNIPEKVTYMNNMYTVVGIGSSAFKGKSTLTAVSVPESVTSIGAYAFYDCTSLTAVSIPESVTTIGASAFQGCSALTTLVFNAENCTSCGSLDNPAFPSSISSLIIGDKVTKIPDYFLYNGSKIENLTIPNSVTSIGNDAFILSSSLISISIPNSVTSIGYAAFFLCSSLSSLTLPNSISTIGTQTFSYCSSLTSVAIPNSVTTIGTRAFEYCSSLTSVTISNSVTSIGSYAFYECSSLTSVTIGSGVLEIPTSTFSGCSSIIKAFWLGNTPPEGVNNVKAKVNYVANKQYSLSNMLVYQFLSSKFDVDGIVYVPVSPSDRTCDVVDCIYDYDNADITIDGTVSNRGIDMTVQKINQYAFYGNSNIKTLKISNSITELGASAYENCKYLESVQIGTGVPDLQSSTFSGCSSLSSITIPNNIGSIGDYVFAGCTALSDITIEDAEDGSQSDTSVSDCLTLGSNGESPLFADCPLDEVYIGRKLSYETSSYSGYSPFYRNTSLRTVEITDAETQIYDNEFYGCSNLKSLKIGNGVVSIGKWAFSGCSSLDYFWAGYKVESIGDEAFSDCTGLTKYYSYSATPPVCGSQALDDINKWECTLYVLDNSVESYKAASQWKEFFFIEETDEENIPSSDVKDIELEESEDIEVYDLNGVKVSNTTSGLTKGVYIVRKGSETKKVFVP